MLVAVIAQKKPLLEPEHDPVLVAQAKVSRILEGGKAGLAHDHLLALLDCCTDRKPH